MTSLGVKREVKEEVNSLRSWELKRTIVKSEELRPLPSLRLTFVLRVALNYLFNFFFNSPFNFPLPAPLNRRRRCR